MASCTGSGTHGPALQLGPKKFADALIRDSVSDKSASHPRATNVDSKYCVIRTGNNLIHTSMNVIRYDK